MSVHDIPTAHQMIPSEKSEEIFSDTIDIPKGEGVLDWSIGLCEDKFKTDMMKYREDFVINTMHWFGEGHKEGDVYDTQETTLHLALRGHEDEAIFAGLRLSPVDSASGSLSWSMLNAEMRLMADTELMKDEDGKDIPSKRVVDELDAIASSGNLWDLTRLTNNIPKNEADFYHIVGGMMELFGTAAGLVRQQQQDMSQLGQVRWLFATTEPMYEQLTGRLGVQMDVITKGMVNVNDTSKSYLCVVDQESAIKYLRQRPDKFSFALQHLEDGLLKANAL